MFTGHIGKVLLLSSIIVRSSVQYVMVCRMSVYVTFQLTLKKNLNKKPNGALAELCSCFRNWGLVVCHIVQLPHLASTEKCLDFPWEKNPVWQFKGLQKQQTHSCKGCITNSRYTKLLHKWAHKAASQECDTQSCFTRKRCTKLLHKQVHKAAS